MKKSFQSISKIVKVTPAEAWEVIGAVDGVDKWFAPVITACRVEGDKRFCSTEAGNFTEDIIEVNHEGRYLKYGIPQQPLMPVSNILGKMTVRKGAEGNAIIDWEWAFDVEENKESEAKSMLAEAGQLGISGIENFIKSGKVRVTG